MTEQQYDCMVVFLDRHSLLIIFRPNIKIWFTAKKDALLLLDWDQFGIQYNITSEQGPPFLGQWFQTIFSRVGTHQAFLQYNAPHATGTAEEVLKQLIDLQQKFHTADGIKWVGALSRVTCILNDRVGFAGYHHIRL